MQLVRYIHQNPLRASIVENLEAYPWSSHHAYTGTREYVFLDIRFVLSLFGHTLSSARAHYLRFMNKTDEDFSSKVYTPVLGDEPFIDKIAVTYRHVLPDKKPQGISMPLPRIVGIVCEVLKINESLIYSSSRHQTVAFARGIIATISIDYAHISLKDVAKFLNRDP